MWEKAQHGTRWMTTRLALRHWASTCIMDHHHQVNMHSPYWYVDYMHKKRKCVVTEALPFLLWEGECMLCYVNETPANVNMMSVHNRMPASVHQPAQSPFDWIVMKVWWFNKSSSCFFNFFWSLLKTVKQHLNYTKAFCSQWMSYVIYNKTER